MEAMFLISTPKPNVMYEYCFDERDDIRDIAKPVYLKQVSESDELKNDFLKQLISEKIDCNFLYSAFKHPIIFNREQFKFIDQLVSHKNHHLRLATIGILVQKDLPEKQRKIWLNKFLEDDKLEINEKVEEYLTHK